MNTPTEALRRSIESAARQSPGPAVEFVPKLKVRNLNFYYGAFLALKNVTLDIAEHKVTAIIGPSGCG
jgi:ABC-type bacteriocin/lantibiotic exporter with double-glycine peptidase domain